MTVQAAAPGRVKATVQGHRALYTVRLCDGAWSCSCKAVTDDGQECAHLPAVQMVTGYPSAAAKPLRSVS